MAEIEKGQFVQVAIGSGGDFYATRASSFPESGTATMAVVADVIPIFRKLGFGKTITVFITPPSYDEWMQRLDSHNLSSEQQSKRFAEAKRSLNFALEDSETHFILNDNLENAIIQCKQIVDNQTDKGRELKARSVAQSLLLKL